uniref:Translation initiation factor eIF2B subunit gamma n=2 Tax=Schistosoma mansoni TaxID=6183 RepID=A0A3Q0KV47_SCHMA
MQALIICNAESPELEQLTIQGSASLLPLGNETVLARLMSIFILSEISDITIVHNKAQTIRLTNYLNENRQLWPDYMKVNLRELPNFYSLSETLQRIRSSITSNYLFITYSNTVISEIDLRDIFLTMIRKKASVVAVFSTLPTTESKLFKSIPSELTVTTNDHSTLISYVPASDIKKQSKLSKNLSYQQTILCRSDLRDCGLYLVSRAALDHVAKLGEDITHRKKSIWQYFWSEPPEINQEANGESDEKFETNNIKNYIECYQTGGTCIHEHRDKIISVKFEDPLIYAETNRLIIQKSCSHTGSQQSGKEFNIIQENCTVHKKAFIRSSFVGSSCKIGADVRILNSVLLSNVEIKDNCTVQGCVIGEKAVIEELCNLKSCTVAAIQRVPTGTNLESKQLGFTDPELNAT